MSEQNIEKEQLYKGVFRAGKKRRNGRKINLEEIINITENKKKYLELLLLGDEKEEMIDRYLERGDMYVLKTPLGWLFV